MNRFEKVKRCEHIDFNLPVRTTAHSAGYDIEIAEDVIIPKMSWLQTKLGEFADKLPNKPGLKEMARFTSNVGYRPTMVATGIKCQLDDGYYLELTLRSSTPQKHWLAMLTPGIIDGDYYNNIQNEGEIFIPVVNYGPKPLHLKKGDIIAQGIIHRYYTVDDDNADGVREGGFGSTTK